MATDNNNNALNNRLKRNLKLLLFGMSFPVVRSHWKTLDDNKRGGKKKDFARMKTIFEWIIIIFLYSVRRGGKFDFETSATMRKRMQQETLPIRKNNCKICFGYLGNDVITQGCHNYHPSCANLWVNCIDKVLPTPS